MSARPPMRVESLEAYDIPAELLAIWRATIGPTLLPVQERAVKEYGLFQTGNLLVLSPTSSGKTFVGEMATVAAARRNTKVFYAVPMKALAEEKFQEFQRRYEPAGIKVVVSSRDHREHDAEIERGDFDVAIVVFEKLQALLVGRPQLMEIVGLVVLDELQLLTDPKRGPALELLLTKLRVAGSHPRIVGLSAVLGQAKLLADWLGARMLVDNYRPVELRKGTVFRGRFQYIEHNSGATGFEQFPDPGTGDRHEQILAIVEALVRDGEQALVFVPDRGTSVELAQRCAERLALGPIEEALAELTDAEHALGREALEQVLAGSIAFHNSDLSSSERSLVERYFRSGKLRAVFATATLAVGVNLPARNAVLDGRKWAYLARYARMSLVEKSKSEIENESGRAARLGHADRFGRAMLVGGSASQAEAAFRQLVAASFDDVEPMLTHTPLEEHVVNLVAAGMARSVAQLEELLLASLTGYAVWSRDRPTLRADLERALSVCTDGGLVRVGAAWSLTPTELGQTCATKGLSVPTTIALAEWARSARALPFSPLEALAVVSQTPDAREIRVGLDARDRRRWGYRAELVHRALLASVGDRPLFEQLALDQSGVELEAAKTYKKTLLVADWLEEAPTAELERSYQVWSGALRRIGEDFGWLVDGLASIASACGWPEARRAEVTELAERLPFGVRADAVPIARLAIPGVGRVLTRRLVDGGFGDLATLRAADRDLLRRTVNHAGAFAALVARLDAPTRTSPARYPSFARAERLLRVADSSPGVAKASAAVERASPAATASADPSPSVTTPTAHPPVDPLPAPALLIDLRDVRVVYRGHLIATRPPKHLQRQPLLALAALASRAGEIVSMADLATMMLELGALPKKPVAPDARDIRYRILEPFRFALANVAPKSEIDSLIEAVRHAGLRLRVAGEVRVVGPTRGAAA